MTETRLPDADVSRYATRRARRAAERQHDVAALAENPQGPAPISQPLSVVGAQLAPAFAEPAPVVDASPSFADLFGFADEPEERVVTTDPELTIEAPVVERTDGASIDIGELVAELAGAMPDEDAPQRGPKHHPKAHRHRRAPQPKSGRKVREPRPARSPRAVRLEQPAASAAGPVAIAVASTRKRRSAGRVVLSAFALVSAAGLAVAMSVPAATFGTPVAFATEDQSAAASVSSAAGSITDGQSVSVVDGSLAAASTATAGRGDNFSAQTYADVIRAQYAGQLYRATFVPTAGAIRWPFSHPVAISAPYGYSSQYAFGWHDGVDFVPGYGAPISAIADGVVIWAGPDGELGYCVRIQHNVGGHTVISIYGHMITDSSSLYPGETVKAGDQVGLTGQTGKATGPHLHLGISVDGQLTDPYVWLTLNATNAK